MTKQGLLAAGLAFGLTAPALAQEVQVVPVPPPDPPASTTIILAPTAPPPPRAETPPPASSTELVWRHGHWRWNPVSGQYIWVEGRYIERPTAVAQWTPGHWEHRPGGWLWIDGSWHY